jgi:putative acetyltransferase
VTIREETEADFLEIAAMTRAAFDGEYEVGLIKKLRTPRLKIASPVAIQEGSVVGHILFSELVVEVEWQKRENSSIGSDGRPARMPEPRDRV